MRITVPRCFLATVGLLPVKRLRPTIRPVSLALQRGVSALGDDEVFDEGLQLLGDLGGYEERAAVEEYLLVLVEEDLGHVRRPPAIDRVKAQAALIEVE